ncbi:MAG: hypothetical protein JWQ60_6334, partial [Pseudonocardia sp.]|nr:hypothetical protein [Pseudonocardia sp.]
MTAPQHAIAPVLAALDMWRPVYQRWWDHPYRRGVAAEHPWSSAEQDRCARLVGVEPGELATAADRLDREAADVDDLGRTVGMLAEAGIGADASGRAGVLGAAIESEVAELTGLATQLRADSVRLESWLAELVQQVLRAGDGAPAGGDHRSVWLAHREADEADGSAMCRAGRGAPEAEQTVEVVRWRVLDELVDRHSAVLRVLRTALAEGDGHIGAIGSWSGDPGGGPEHAVSDTWVSGGTPPTREIV